MAYTIEYFYNKFLNQIDKEGSDFYTVDQVMEILETETSNFIEAVVKYLENTQQLRDYLLPLYTSYNLTYTQNPLNTAEWLVNLPSDYRNLESVRVVTPNVNIRKTSLVRKAELDINRLNPNQRPTPQYPCVFLYNNGMAIEGPSVAGTVRGFYIAKPTFGDATGNISTEILVNLPDQSVEKIMLLMVNNIHAKAGDQRYQLSFAQEKSYGKASK